MPTLVAEVPSTDIGKYLSSGAYDFIDFGCSRGGSLAYGVEKLGGTRGLGIDLSPEKINRTRAAGFDACLADARELMLHPDSVRFVTMIDFLEHLPGIDDARHCIDVACAAATDFVFIRQPWFDADPYLFPLGLKVYWSDWSGHRNAMTTLDFYRIMRGNLKIRRWGLYARRRIVDSSDPAVHTLDSPAAQHNWSEDTHPPKPAITFSVPVFYQVGCVAIVNDEPDLLRDLEKRADWTDWLFDSRKGYNPAVSRAVTGRRAHSRWRILSLKRRRAESNSYFPW